MTFLESFLEDLAQLVNRDCGSDNYYGVTKAAEIMREHFDSIGFQADLVNLGNKAGKGMFATNKPGAEKYDVMLNAHLDTVFPDGTAEKRPFSVKGSRAYGPGCSDCKAGVLAILYAIKNARPEDLKRLAIAVAFNPDEETGSKNSADWLGEIAQKSRRACVFEPARPSGELVRSRKGASSIDVKFHGRSAHAGNMPYKGANANVAAMRFALAAYGLADVERGLTVNPGIIHGGSAVNVIPDECTVSLDMRYLTNEDRDLIVKEIERLCKATWAPRVTQKFKWGNRGPAMPLSKGTQDMAALLSEAARLEGFEIDFVDAGGASDGNKMAERGIPVIDGCGPAGGELHTEREYLELETVEPRIRMISRFLSLI